MGARGGGGGRGGRGGGGAGAPTAGQVNAARVQYQKAKAAYDTAAKSLNDAVSQMRPGGPKVNYQKVQNNFTKASNRLDKAHAKWTQLKQAKKIADMTKGNS